MTVRISAYFTSFCCLVMAVLVLLTPGWATAEPAADLTPQLGVQWQHAGPLKPGDTVEISLQGFPALVAVEIGAGPPQSEYTVWTHGQTTARGALRARVTIPLSIPPEIALVFVAATQDFEYRAQSQPIGLINSPQPTDPSVAGSELISRRGSSDYEVFVQG
jgi:hypothetical protein